MMRSKLTTITPVHIASGELKRSFEYNKQGSTIYNYALNDVFSQIPESILLDSRFLRDLKNPPQQGSRLAQFTNQVRRYVRYNQMQPAYELECNFDYLEENNISVQMKSLNRPYIPGSSIKGAILTAVYYHWLKSNIKYLYEYEGHRDRNGSIRVDIDQLMMKKYGRDTKFSDFIKQFRNCFSCEDVLLDKMIYMNAVLKHVDLDKQTQDNEKMKIPDVECIHANQEYRGHIITIDKEKAKRLLQIYSGYRYINEFKYYFNYGHLIEICDQYFKDMIGEELNTDNQYGFYSTEGVYNALKKFHTESFKNGFYLRIGHHTNYFFKTVSYLVKKNNPQLYERRFKELFSPKSGNRPPFPDPKTMPATRTLFYDDYYVCYPGVIKIEFFNEK